MPMFTLTRLLLCSAAIGVVTIGEITMAQTPEVTEAGASVDVPALKQEADRLYAAKDFPALLPVMERLVAAGDAQAANNLATMYGNGLGVRADQQRARDLYRSSAESGYAPAQVAMGYGHLYGHWGKVDTTEAKRWCTLAADQRDPEGLVCLARMHGTGQGFVENKPIAMELLRKAVALDSVEAMRLLGLTYWAGDDAPQSDAKGVEYLRMAANMGDIEAMLELGDAYRTGQHAAQDETAARDWYRKAADQDHVGGKVNLALMLVEGLGGDADPIRAFAMMKSAAEAGDLSAQLNLAKMYEDGSGTGADAFAAHQWLNEAARAPDLDAAQRAMIKFRLDCLCNGLSKQQMAKAKATSPMPAGAQLANRN